MSEPVLSVVCTDPVLPPRCGAVLKAALGGFAVQRVAFSGPGGQLRGRRILFVVSLDEAGIGRGLNELLSLLRLGPGLLSGSTAGLFVDGEGELYTKAVARELALAADLAGCTLVGSPLVEATGSLSNFAVRAARAACTPAEACVQAVADLARRILAFEPARLERPQLLVLHASNHRTSNTLALWDCVKTGLGGCCGVTEIGLRNGVLEDCSGCPYTMCLHFGEKGDCFYGGVMVHDVYPAVRAADAVLLLCPNYNDALPANLTAAINRLTALYRAVPLDGKALYGIVVSGYSGGDLVAGQLVSSLCMNKGFYLPPQFCMLETANDAGSALKLPGIGERTAAFAARIRAQLCMERR